WREWLSRRGAFCTIAPRAGALASVGRRRVARKSGIVRVPLQEIRAESAAAPSRSGRRRDLATALLLGLIALLIYNANLRSITAVDTYAARYLPLSILRYESLLLDPIAETVAQGRALPTIYGKPD